jgi:creatinine amidohydrolase
MVAKVRMADMSWREVEQAIDRGAVALVPLGSTEEHGPHAPMGDFIATDVISERAAQETGDVMTPTFPFGYSEYFRHYPGTITLQAETFGLLVKDTVTSLLDQGFRHVVLLNGHKGNEPILQVLVRRIRRERGVLIPFLSPFAYGLPPELERELYGDVATGHGGEPHGSEMSYLRPELVDLSRIEDWGKRPFLGLPAAGLNGVTFNGQTVGMAINMEDITPASGSSADPRPASADKGEKTIGNAVAGVAAFVRWFKTVDPQVNR